MAERPGPAMREWGTELATRLLTAPEPQDDATAWVNHPLANRDPADPWVVEPRLPPTATRRAPFFTSFPKGETLTGSLHSKPFAAPESLTFYLAGQDGPPVCSDQGQQLRPPSRCRQRRGADPDARAAKRRGAEGHMGSEEVRRQAGLLRGHRRQQRHLLGVDRIRPVRPAGRLRPLGGTRSRAARSSRPRWRSSSALKLTELAGRFGSCWPNSRPTRPSAPPPPRRWRRWTRATRLRRRTGRGAERQHRPAVAARLGGDRLGQRQHRRRPRSARQRLQDRPAGRSSDRSRLPWPGRRTGPRRC